MENRTHAFAAGLFVFLLGIAAATAVKWLSGDDINHNHYFLISAGGSVSGLNPEASVRYRGVNIGKVEEIYFDQENIRNIIVRIAVSSQVKLPKNTYAQLASQGITGLTYIELNDELTETEPKYLEDGAHISLRASLIKTMFDSLEEILGNSNMVIKQINNLLNEKNQTYLSNILHYLEQAVQHYDQLAKQLQSSSQSLPQLSHEFATTLRQSHQVMENTNQVLQKLNQPRGLVDNLTQGSQKMASTLAGLHETSQAVIHSTRKLDQLLNLLATHPQSLIFGKPSAEPGPGESGFTPPQPPSQLPIK
jgi:phospholipid/cholesterol/gamma-HCH transport system substrate-binding protein